MYNKATRVIGTVLERRAQSACWGSLSKALLGLIIISYLSLPITFASLLPPGAAIMLDFYRDKLIANILIGVIK